MIKNIKPTISVIMPFYNCEKFLDDSIQSILNQTFGDFELIIINDASTDKSDEIVKKYLKKDKRIKYIRNKKNIGKARNCNLGMANSIGKYIAIMDGDDISLPERLEKQINFLLKNPDIDIVGTQMNLINLKNSVVGEILKPVSSKEIKRLAFLFQAMNHGTILCKSEILKKFGYREKYKEFEDNDILTRMFISGVKGYNIPEKLYLYRMHVNNSSKKSNRKKALKFLQFQKEIIKTYNYKTSLKEKIFMYGYFITGIVFDTNQRRKIQAFVKEILYPKLGK